MMNLSTNTRVGKKVGPGFGEFLLLLLLTYFCLHLPEKYLEPGAHFLAQPCDKKVSYSAYSTRGWLHQDSKVDFGLIFNFLTVWTSLADTVYHTSHYISLTL